MAASKEASISNTTTKLNPQETQTRIVSLKNAFTAYSQDSRRLLDLKASTVEEYECIKTVLSKTTQTEMDAGAITLLDAEDQLDIDKVKQNPSLIVIGQTNSGKSSLINELLGGTVVAMRQIPCTARLVKLKYGKKQLVRVVSKSGEVLEERAIKKKTIPRDLVDLTEEQRHDPIYIGSHVEAEIDNDFLKSGIKLIDSPGLQEDENLDNIVLGELKNTVPFVVYVLDGNNQLTEQDRKDIKKIKDQTDTIFFVVTKVDSDADNDEVEISAEEKKRRAYDSLVKDGLLPHGVRMEECVRFHGISNWKVKEYRRAKKCGHDPFVADFQRLQRSICTFVESSLDGIIIKAARILLASHTHCIDFFITHATGAKEKMTLSEDTFRSCKESEKKVFTDAIEKLEERKNYIHRKISSTIERDTPDIIESAREFSLPEIPVDDYIKRNQAIDKCSESIQQLVLDKISAGVEQTLADIFTDEDSILTDLAEVVKRLEETGTGSDVSDIIRQCTMSSYRAESVVSFRKDSVLSRLLEWFRKSFTSETKRYEAVVTIDKSWKEAEALKALKRVDAKIISNEIIRQAKKHLETCRRKFAKAMDKLKTLLTSDIELSEKERLKIRDRTPAIAELELRTYSVIDKREFGFPVKGEEIGKGGQGSVYDCGKMGPGKTPCVFKELELNKQTAMEVHYTR
ncbi:dual serine/threonine and tyrosine protein kinase-like [Saccoglossus kowalevskii]